MTISPRAESQKIYEVILAQANVPRRVTIAAPKGSESAVLDSELVYYQRPGEGALYVGGLFPKATLLTPVEVRFPAKAHLYDVRQGKYFGHADRLADTIHEKGAKVYAALPYRVVALGTSLERPSAETPYRAGEDVSFTVSVAADAKPGLHIIHLRVYSAAGSEVEAHRCNLVAEKGAARHSFPLALNAPEGRWRILLTDVASGVQGVVWFDVVR
jgi:hypothetical protein